MSWDINLPLGKTLKQIDRSLRLYSYNVCFQLKFWFWLSINNTKLTFLRNKVNKYTQTCIWSQCTCFGLVWLTTDGRGSQGLLCDAACLSRSQTSFKKKRKKKVHPRCHHIILTDNLLSHWYVLYVGRPWPQILNSNLFSIRLLYYTLLLY